MIKNKTKSWKAMNYPIRRDERKTWTKAEWKLSRPIIRSENLHEESHGGIIMPNYKTMWWRFTSVTAPIIWLVKKKMERWIALLGDILVVGHCSSGTVFIAKHQQNLNQKHKKRERSSSAWQNGPSKAS